MKQFYVAFLTFCLLGSLADADQRSDPFRALLAHLPLSFLGPVTDRRAIDFIDLRAAAVALSAPPTGTNPLFLSDLGPHYRATLPDLSEVVNPDTATAWQGLVGFTPDQIRAAISVEWLPDSAMLLQLDPGAMAGVQLALRVNGYEATEKAGYPALFRGGEDGAIDLAARNPADPFGDGLGMASRIGMQGDLLLQSRTWPVLTSLMQPSGDMLADQPEIAALLGALDTAPAGLGGLVQVKLLTDPFSFGVNAPIMELTGDRQADQQTMPTVPASDLPFWTIGLLADLATPDTETALVALIYPTQAMADIAAARLQSGWQDQPTQTTGQSFATIIGAPAVTSVMGSGPFVVVLTATVQTEAKDGMIRNQPFTTLMQAYARRDLLLLAPQMP